MKNPPFHTIIFDAETFFDPTKHLDYYGEFKSHEDITRVFTHLILPDFRYCVVAHKPMNQISTIFSHPFRGKMILDENQKREVLTEFGL